MAFFNIIRALFVRMLFTIHGLTTIWRLYIVKNDPIYWLISLGLLGLIFETIITIRKKQGQDWKWFCPSVFFYLLTLVPAIWFLEIYEMEKRIKFRRSLNVTGNILPEHAAQQNETNTGLSAKIASLGLEINIPLRLTSDQWVKTLEQILLLFLIIGRWLLPKGKLTHDQLSQLLLVYIGTAADIVEFFDAFKEDEVRYNPILCMVILAIWSWSLLQFTMVLTATKARKDQSGLASKPYDQSKDIDYTCCSCCTPDVYGIVISIFLQDAPFLVLRLLLIFKYNVVSYTNMFFTCKNTLVILLLMYRLVVVQMELRQKRNQSRQYLSMSESSSGARLLYNTESAYSTLDFKKKYNVGVRDVKNTEDIKVDFVIKRHISIPDDLETAKSKLSEAERSGIAPRTDSLGEDFENFIEDFENYNAEYGKVNGDFDDISDSLTQLNSNDIEEVTYELGSNMNTGSDPGKHTCSLDLVDSTPTHPNGIRKNEIQDFNL